MKKSQMKSEDEEEEVYFRKMVITGNVNTK